MRELGYERPIESLSNSVDKFLHNNLNRIFLIEVNEKVVGYAAIALNNLLVTEFNRCRIENLIVSKKHRRKGLASKLIQKIEKYSLEKGVSIIDVTSSQKRKEEGAYDFYEKHGYINSGEEMRAYFRKRLVL